MSKKEFYIIAGPCVVESKKLLEETAGFLKNECEKYGFKFIFKSSYKKANRTSLTSFTGIGDEIALNYLAEIKEEFDVEVITDVHSEKEIDLAAVYVDYLQIPAFLCRQTELLVAAGKTGKGINIKKGQFLAPDAMEMAIEKVTSTENKNILITERGTSFGYNDLVVDFRSIQIMKKFGYPVIYDATHSVQKPSIGIESGGSPEFIPALTRAAIAVGVDGVFLETHPDPAKAKSDSASQLKLSMVPDFLDDIHKILEIDFKY